MDDETKVKMMEALAKGGMSVGQLIVENTGSITYNDNRGRQEADQQRQVELSTMVGCVDRVRQYFWSDSSMAVVFCVCRDYFNYADNMSQFERDFNCAEGLLSNTFRNNAYMRLPIDKWEQNGAKERVMKLVEAYQNAVLEASQK